LAIQSSLTTRLKTALEVLSVVGPIICLIDCIVIPAVLMVLPLVGIKQIFHGISDQILLLLVLAICTPTITTGFIKHRRVSVMIFMAIGFSLMFFASFAGHVIDESLHLILTSLGSVFLIKANWDNRQFSKGKCCEHHLTVHHK
jgi:hypothetical protein